MLADEFAHARSQLLIRGMGVDHRREGTGVPREPLGEEQIPRGTIDVRDGLVTGAVVRWNGFPISYARST